MAAATDDTTQDNETQDQPPALSGTFGLGVPNEEELAGIVTRASNLERQLDTLIAAHRDRIERKKAELDADAADTSRGFDANAEAKDVIARAAKQKATRAYDEFVRGVRILTAPNRDGLLNELDAINKRAEVVTKLFPTPVQMLAVAGLGSAERTTYHTQTAHAGPAELASLANYAIANGNSILGAALMARLGTLPKGAKPFSALGLANAMVGERHRNLIKTAQTVSATFQRFVNQNRAFERGKTDVTANMADALRLNALSA
jgi:hypothetical protein